MASESVTIHLSDALYRAASRIARATNQPVDAVLEASIARSLPPLEDVSDEQASDLASLALLGDGELWQIGRSMLSAEEQERLHELLDRQGQEPLDETERAELQSLLDAYGRLTVRKAHAYLLLARRGYRVPVQTESQP